MYNGLIYIFVYLFINFPFYNYCQNNLPSGRHITNFTITNWQTENGLPQNSIQAILQTKDGYIWLGTQQGLVRFDGVQFTVFNSKKNLFFYINISALCEGSNNTLWVATNGGGLIKFKQGEFSSFNLDEKYILSLYSDKKGNILAGSDKCLYLIKDNNHVNLCNTFKLPAAAYYILFEDEQGKIWIRNSKGEVYIYYNQDITRYDYKSPIDYIYKDRGGRLWIASNNKLVLEEKHQIKTFTIKDGFNYSKVRAIQEDLSNNILIATVDKGLYYYTKNSFIKYTSTEGLSNDLISSLFVDKENNIWIGTLGGGLNKFTQNNISTISKEDGLKNTFVFTTTEDTDGGLWIGTYGGGLYNYQKGIFKNFTTNDGLSNNIIRAVFCDSKNNIWIGTYGSGVNIYDGKKFSVYKLPVNLNFKFIYSFFEDSENNIWIGSSNGLLRIKEGNFKFYNETNGLKSPFIRGITEDKKGTIWVATDVGGIAKLVNDKFIAYTVDNGLASNFTRSVYSDKEGLLWITSNRGLSSFDGAKFINYTADDGFNETIYQAIEDDKDNFWLSSNKGVLKVLRKNLQDFSKGRIKDLPIIKYDKLEGMLSSECNGGNQPAGIKTKDGRIIFPNLKGLVVINPLFIKGNIYPPAISINEITVDGNFKEVSSAVELDAGSSRLEIRYSALSFTNPQKVNFKYMLEGIDKDWINAGTRRTAYYNYLSPGEYKFKVIACNNDGVWNTNPASMIIKLNPFFYETVLFYVMVIVLFIGLGPSIYYFRVRSLKNTEKKLYKVVEERTKSLREEKEKSERALSEAEETKKKLSLVNEELKNANQLKTDLINMAIHDLKNPLGAVYGFSQMILEEHNISNETADMVALIKNSTDSMLIIINDLLKVSYYESDKIKIEFVPVDIKKVIKDIIDLHRPLYLTKQQSVILECDDKIIVSADESRLVEVFDNLLSNSIKYSPLGKTIFVKVRQSGLHARIEFKDEGPGLTEKDKEIVFGKFEKLSAKPTGNETSTGLGLSIVKQLVELMNGKVWVESEEGTGASFFVELNLS